MDQKKEYKLYKRRWVVLLSFVSVNAVMQYGWAFFSSIVTDAWHFFGFQDAASGEAAISAPHHDHHGLHDRFFHPRQLGVRKNRLV